MNERTNFRLLPAVVLAGLALLIASSGGCSAATQAAGGGCSALDSKSQAQATVIAWAGAIDALNTTATTVEAEWLTVCNDINQDLGLAAKTTASDACGALKTYIQTDLKTKAVTLALVVSPPNCEADLGVEASCEANCNVDASCDVAAHCTMGDVVVGCNGTCSGACDVTDPTLTCNATCKGECDAAVAVHCTGQCTGTCDAPTWNGTCDAGCSASFTGSCGGNCTGTCDGSTASGAKCAGKCVGTCDAKASGQCGAQCTGHFSGGQCSGMCTGGCNVAAGASCSGMCKGTCTYMPGSATCNGQCHGTCSLKTTPPTCNGMVDCAGSAECHADCQTQAHAKLKCTPPQASVQIMGDDTLFAAFENHLAEISAAFNDTIELNALFASVASKTTGAFSAIGDIGLAGAACVASEAQVASSASVHVSVCVSASATVSGQTS